MGVITRNTYDASGNLLSAVRDAGLAHLRLTTSWTWNARGDALTVTDPKGNVTTSTYDAGRRVLTTTTPATEAAPAGIVTSYTYDPAGRVTQTRQSSSGTVLRTTSATYTASGQPATATDANGTLTRFGYDLLDRRSKVIDPIGRITTFTFDALGRPWRTYNITIQAGPLLQQTYTDNGQRETLTDANGKTTNFAYDGFDRLATTTYPYGTTETYAYDADNNVTKRCTRAGQPIAFTYDTLDRVLTKTLPGAAATCNATPSGTVVTYAYDRAGRVTSISDNSSAITAAATTSTIFTTSYTYDAINSLTGVTFGPAPTPTLPSASSSVTLTHGYNRANQRSSFAVTDSNWINYPTAAASATCYTANDLNQYTSLRFTSALNCTGGTTAIPTYDTNGNLTDDGSTYKYEYDAENRLVTSKTSGGSTIGTYTFDAQGRRKSKAVSGTTTIFVTDADNREVLEYDGTTGSIQRWHAYGLGPNALLGNMNVAASVRSTPVPDLLGSIIGSMDASNGSLNSFSYRPYGGSASTPSQFAYTGQRVDVEVGDLYYYRARYYSPALGRFLQTDPIGYSADIHLYAYVNNDPLNATDPSGEFLNIIGGGLLNVAIGYGISRLSGEDYSLGQAALDFGIGAATGGLAALSAARRGTQIVEGIYSVPTKTGQTYVGQSGDIATRLSQHVASGKITQSAANNATKYEVLGGQTCREVAEQLAINARGGVPSLANKVNPIGGRPWLLNNPQLGIVTQDNLVNWAGVTAADVLIDSLLISTPAYGGSSTRSSYK